MNPKNKVHPADGGQTAYNERVDRPRRDPLTIVNAVMTLALNNVSPDTFKTILEGEIAMLEGKLNRLKAAAKNLDVRY